jgi:transcriptional regulator with XRE-family HTH domain
MDMDAEVEYVLDNIRKIRCEKEMSVVELASQAGIARSYLFYLESHQKIPTLKTMHKLAKALGVTMKDFFT